MSWWYNKWYYTLEKKAEISPHKKTMQVAFSYVNLIVIKRVVVVFLEVEPITFCASHYIAFLQA